MDGWMEKPRQRQSLVFFDGGLTSATKDSLNLQEEFTYPFEDFSVFFNLWWDNFSRHQL